MRQLSVLEIAVFNKDLCRDRDEDCIWISSVYNSSNLLYDIIDIALVNLTMSTVSIPGLLHNSTNNTSLINFKFDLVVICEIERAFSNLFLVYNDVEIYPFN